MAWNEGGDWEFMSPPALATVDPQAEPLVKAESSSPTVLEEINELLLDELRDILHAEKQLTKALPMMARQRGSIACASASRSILLKPKPRSNGSTSAFRFSRKPHAPSAVGGPPLKGGPIIILKD